MGCNSSKTFWLIPCLDHPINSSAGLAPLLWFVARQPVQISPSCGSESQVFQQKILFCSNTFGLFQINRVGAPMIQTFGCLVVGQHHSISPKRDDLNHSKNRTSLWVRLGSDAGSCSRCRSQTPELPPILLTMTRFHNMNPSRALTPLSDPVLHALPKISKNRIVAKPPAIRPLLWNQGAGPEWKLSS